VNFLSWLYIWMFKVVNAKISGEKYENVSASYETWKIFYIPSCDYISFSYLVYESQVSASRIKYTSTAENLLKHGKREKLLFFWHRHMNISKCGVKSESLRLCWCDQTLIMRLLMEIITVHLPLTLVDNVTQLSNPLTNFRNDFLLSQIRKSAVYIWEIRW
jgi:hypothetical protein